MGLTCVNVENGKIGLDLLKESNPPKLDEFDLILMDCHMPVMDGFEATRQIRELEKQHHLPHTHIVAITAGQNFDECCSAGVCNVIWKPLKKETFSSVIGSFIKPPSHSVDLCTPTRK